MSVLERSLERHFVPQFSLTDDQISKGDDDVINTHCNGVAIRPRTPEACMGDVAVRVEEAALYQSQLAVRIDWAQYRTSSQHWGF